jgi:aspartokinase
MHRIADLVEEYVLETPLVEEHLSLGLINLSALARHLRPRITKALLKPASEASIMMALKRLAPRVAVRTRPPVTRTARPSDLTVRSNLVELTFHTSDTIREKHRRLLNRADRADDAFVTYTQGAAEVMLMVSAGLEKAVQEVFAGERLVSKVRNLSALVIRLAPATVQTPGVYYAILKRLAWQDINVVDVVSTYTEFTIVVANDQVDAAFSALRRYFWP